MFGKENIKNIKENFSCDFTEKVNLDELNDTELNTLIDELYGIYFDCRKVVDEANLVCGEPHFSIYINIARMKEAEAKYLYALWYRAYRNVRSVIA